MYTEMTYDKMPTNHGGDFCLLDDYEKIICYVEKNKIESHNIKVNSKWITDLNVKEKI